MLSKLANLAALTCLCALAAPALAADPIVLKFAHEAPETAIKGQSAKKFADLVKEYTKGSVVVEVYPGGQLVPTVDEIRAVARGQVDIIAPYTSYFSSIDKAWDVFYQPLLYSSPEDAVQKLAGPVGDELLSRLSSRGMTGLAIWHDGPVYLFSKGAPITAPKDMTGRKVRVAPSRPLEAGLGSVNATAVAIPATEVYLALQQGVADSVLTTPTYVGPAKWNEVLEYGNKLMFGQGGYAVVANQKSLDKLDAQQREAFMRAAKDAERWNHGTALENIRQWEQKLQEGGMKWTESTDADKAAWQSFARAAESAQSPEAKALIEKLRK